MNILHVIPTLDPSSGGPPMVAVRLAASQAALGHHVTVASYQSPDAVDRIKLAYQDVPFVSQVTTHALPGGSRLEPILASAGRRELRPLMTSCDVVHLHAVWNAVSRIAAAEARRQDRPYFVLAHGMLDPWSLKQKALKKRLALMLGYRRMLDGAAALQLLNNDERELVRPLKLRSAMTVIPNGVFLEEFACLPAAALFRSHHPGLGNDPYILFLSRLHYKKGLDLLAQAFADVAKEWHELHLVVAGPDEGAAADFRERLHGCDVFGRVHLTGPLYGSEKLSALAGACCFCLPSRQEGFSIAITEALACGKPAVVTEACHFPEIAEVGAGVITALTANSVSEGLRRVLRDPAGALAMGDAGRELVRQRFTWPHIAGQTIEMYRRFRNDRESSHYAAHSESTRAGDVQHATALDR